jgi:anti-sigma28 factor (negative regulator of flagellin synthesis)
MNELDPVIKTGRRNTTKELSKSDSKPITGKKTVPGNVDKVSISNSTKAKVSAGRSKSNTGEIRYELVNKFRDILQNESYEVKAHEIADKIVQKIRENKNHLIL